MLTYDWTKNGGQVSGVRAGHPFCMTKVKGLPPPECPTCGPIKLVLAKNPLLEY
jgi:hypothetical protein